MCTCFEGYHTKVTVCLTDHFPVGYVYQVLQLAPRRGGEGWGGT